jgi:hypothetical protein
MPNAVQDEEQQERSVTASGNKKLYIPLRKTVLESLTELNIFLPHDPEIMLLGIYPKELKNYIYRKTFIHVYSIFIHNCPNLEVIKMSFYT